MAQQALQKGGEHVNGEENVSMDGCAEVSSGLTPFHFSQLAIVIIYIQNDDHRQVRATDFRAISIRGQTQRQILSLQFHQNHMAQGKPICWIHQGEIKEIWKLNERTSFQLVCIGGFR